MDQELSIIFYFILINDDYVTQQFRENCERITLYPETVEDAELV